MRAVRSILGRGLKLTRSLSGSQMVLIACFPKSASSFLQNCIALLGDYTTDHLCNGHMRQEQDLYAPAMLDNAFRNVVTHQHVRATDANLDLLQTMKGKTIVTVRNLADVVVSFRDHCVKKTVEFSMAYVDESFRDLPKELQYDMVIDLIVPWYIYFYVSWKKAEKEVPLLWVTYEDMVADKVGTIRDICEYTGIRCTDDEIRDAIKTIEGDRDKSNYNKGVAGRGSTELSDAQKLRLERLASYYPDVDFSMIGL